MSQHNYDKKRNVLIGTCWFTAMLNAVFSTGYAQETQDPGSGSDDAVAERVLRYGIFDVRPTIQAGAFWDDNIFTQRSNREADLVWGISPGLTVGAGDYRESQDNLLFLSYSPTFNIFTENSSENSVDHDAKVAGQYRTGSWLLALQQTYQRRHDNVVDVGTRVARDFWTTTGSVKYEFSPKTLLDFFGSASFNEFEGTGTSPNLCYNEYTAGVGLDYSITPKTKLGPAVKGGWIDQKNQSDQNYQQLLARATYFTTEKVSLRAAVGVELRNFQGDTSEDSEVNPVLELGATYKPLELITISLDAYRREQPSVSVPTQNYSTTGGAIGVNQTFREFYSVNLRGGYEHLEYEDRSTAVAVSDREDDYFFVRVGFDWRALDKLTASIWYQYRQNTSSNDPFDFHSNQVGLSFAYRL